MRNNKGFTIIEILMVILLVAILSAVAIPQFLDFRTEARNAATQSALGALRSGIANAKGNMILRCNAGPGAWPTALNVAGNDVTAGAGALCTNLQITNADERKITSGSLPANPWGASGTGNGVTDCSAGAASCVRTAPCSVGGAWAGTEDGWCYNPATGDIWANSDRSPNDEATF